MRFSIAAVSAVAFGALGAMAAEITIAEAGGPRLGRQVREGDAAPARIHYRLGTSAEIATVIDNERGQRVRNLVAQVERPAGEHAEPWDLADGREPQYVPMAEEIEWFLEDQFVIRHDGARAWEQDGYHAYVGFSGGAPVSVNGGIKARQVDGRKARRLAYRYPVWRRVSSAPTFRFRSLSWRVAA